MNTERYYYMFENHTKNVWVLFKKPKLVHSETKEDRNKLEDQMMQDNTPINFYIKHFFINCQIKKLQPIFDTFVPPCIRCIHLPPSFCLSHNFQSSIRMIKLIVY
jgi:hypothetical protein